MNKVKKENLEKTKKVRKVRVKPFPDKIGYFRAVENTLLRAMAINEALGHEVMCDTHREIYSKGLTQLEYELHLI